MAAPYGTEPQKTVTTLTSTVVAGAPVLGPAEWTQTLCGCTDNCSICCEECWCGYCHLGYLYDTIEHGGHDMDPIVCCGALTIDCFIGGIARCLVIMHLRDRLIKRYRIPEGGCKNCCTTCWCSSCAMCQMHREMETRQEYTGGCCYKPPVPPGAPMGVTPGHVQHQQQTTAVTTAPAQPQPYQQPPPPQQPYQPQHMQPAYAAPPQQQYYPQQSSPYHQPAYQQPPPQAAAYPPAPLGQPYTHKTV